LLGLEVPENLHAINRLWSRIQYIVEAVAIEESHASKTPENSANEAHIAASTASTYKTISSVSNRIEFVPLGVWYVRPLSLAYSFEPRVKIAIEIVKLCFFLNPGRIRLYLYETSLRRRSYLP
jgi:hypothetical protein